MTERLRVLVVDDDAPARRAIASFIARKGDTVREAEDGANALSILDHELIDVVLSDVRMPKLDGIALTRALRTRSDDSVVVLMSAFATIDNVIEAMREGAYDYLVKPIDPENLNASLNRVRERLALRRRVRSLTAALSARDALTGLAPGGPAMRSVLEAARRASQSDLPVLVTGETGSGRAQLAQSIHGLSPRSSGPLVIVNAAQLGENSVELELFGHEGETGKIAKADGGTVLIDELGALPANAQARLTRLLEQRTIDRGPNTPAIPIDVRIVATAGRALQDELKAGRFREDLYYRLRVIEITMPPLRDRREDIPQLAEQILSEERTRRNIGYRITPEALSLLMAAPWPGNVRELANVIRAAAAMAPGELLESEHLPPALRANGLKTSTLAEQVAAYERAVLRQALESVHGQVGRVAAALGVPERTLRRKMRVFGLAKEAFRRPTRHRPTGGVIGT